MTILISSHHPIITLILYVDDFEKLLIEEHDEQNSRYDFQRYRHQQLTLQANRWKEEYGFTIEDAFTGEELEDKCSPNDKDEVLVSDK